MTGRTHIAAAGLLGGAIAFKMGISVEYMFTSVIGGLWADTDHRKSILGRLIPFWLFFRTHRKSLLHSLTGAFIFSGVLLWLMSLSPPIDMYHPLFFLIGYLSHLLLDSFNTQGVRIFWPYAYQLSFANIKVGGIGELITLFLFYTIVITVMSL